MKKIFFALPFLLAGCQTERVAYRFQPVPPTRGVALAVASGAGRADTGAAASGSGPAERTTTSQPAYCPAATYAAGTPSALRPGRPIAGQKQAARPVRATTPQALPAAAPEALDAPVALIPTAPKSLVGKLLFHPLTRQRATAGPAHTTENGLGGIALFFIGVVLALLAGLGALVSLIFGTGFFTGVGFAAAGLVVLFLLYKLLSGDGKKKAKPTK